MPENVKASDQLSEQEIAERRDEIVRAMIATPPKDRPKNPNGKKLGRPVAS